MNLNDLNKMIRQFHLTFKTLNNARLRPLLINLPTHYLKLKVLRNVHVKTCSMSTCIFITKTYLYNFDPHKPHFYIVKLGFTGVYIICLISVQNIDCGYSLEPPRRGGSNEYPQSMF